MKPLFHIYREGCTARLRGEIERRPGNALNVEIGAPIDRCLDKRPHTWHEGSVSGVRWLASGGDPLIFGPCAPTCPRLCAHADGEKCWWCSDLEEREDVDIDERIKAIFPENK